MFKKPITLSDRLSGYKVNGVVKIPKEKIPNDDLHIICVMKNNVHRANKQQKNCDLYELERR
jgi:hypothetical protein